MVSRENEGERRLRRRLGWWLALVLLGLAMAIGSFGGATLDARAASDDKAAAGRLQGRITFASDRDGDFEIYVMNADGSGLRQVTRNRRQDFSPSWSPNGRRIAYTSCPRECPLGNSVFIPIDHCADTGIYVASLNGSRIRKFKDSHRLGAIEYDPEWSPDGRWIAYAVGGTCTDGGEVHALNVRNDRERHVAVTDHSSMNWHPTWSPDGEEIALNCGWDTIEVCVNRFDGNGHPTQRVLVEEDKEVNPAFSPNGELLVGVDRAEPIEPPEEEEPECWPVEPICLRSFFGRTQSRAGMEWDFNLSIFSFEDEGLRKIVGGSHNSLPGDWAPDGKRVVFYDNRHGSYDIFVIRRSGEGLRRITNHRGHDVHPDWTHR